MGVCLLCNKKIGSSEGCTFNEIRIDGKWYQRIKSDIESCDCGSLDGKTHHFGCDMEKCPVCYGQMIWCNCLGEKEAFRNNSGDVIFIHFGAYPNQARFIEDLIVENDLNSALIYEELEDSDIYHPKNRFKVENGDIIELNLSNLGIKIIPTSIKELKNLRSLNLKNNQLKTLPKSIESLKKLKIFTLEGNPLSSER